MKNYTKRIYRVRCKSGAWGWRTRLQNNYTSYGEWGRYSDTYNLTKRIGFNNTFTAWLRNPVVEGSTNPSDFRKVKA